MAKDPLIDPNLPDPLPGGRFSRNIVNVLAVIVVLMLVVYLLGGPGFLHNSPLGLPPTP